MREIKTISVIGANGVMGRNISGIFASFGKAKVYMICRDLEKAKKAVELAVKSVRADSIRTNLVPVDYSVFDKVVSESDLIFESMSEDLEIKKEITRKIGNIINQEIIICSGTSGLSITELAECLPERLRANYFGVHMFNPPYNLTLCELIKTKYTSDKIAIDLKKYLENNLYRTVVEVKDSPAFLANRIGFQFINEVLQFAERYKDKGGIDYIDSIFGSFSGRAMPPIVTADFVGLDVHKAIVDNLYKNTCDYAHESFLLPEFVEKLIESDRLGRKSGEGLYKEKTMVYDIKTGEYREKVCYEFDFAKNMKKYIRIGDYKKAMRVIISDSSVEANICLDFLLRYIIYSISMSKQISEDINAADDCMAKGFNWCPPLALIEAISLVENLESLIKTRLEPSFLDKLDIKNLFLDLKPSRYDYRSYLRSK